MDTISQKPYITRFIEASKTDPTIQAQRESHQRRRKAAQSLFTQEHLPIVTRDELDEFLKDTDAFYGVRGKVRLFQELFGENDEKLDEVRSLFSELMRRAEIGLRAEDLDEIRPKLRYLGPAFVSEILVLCFPERYWQWNGQVRRFLEANGIDITEEISWGKKSNLGEQYFAAGRHLAELRRALSEAMGEPIDYLRTDNFIWWFNHQEEPDPWAKRIAQWLKERFPPERSRARVEGEKRARALLENKVGRFREEDLREFANFINTDWWDGKERSDRFMPALYDHQVNLIAGKLDAFNEWAARIWSASEGEIGSVLDSFWEASQVPGAGSSLPTALLYAKDPERYNIWIPVMEGGLRQVTDYEPGQGRRGQSYLQYNQKLIEFREQYQLPPQSLDAVLYQAAKFVEETAISFEFPGFVEETFRFLKELVENNTTEWMQKDDGANKKRYQTALREPLRQLFEAVAPRIQSLDPNLETDVKFGKVLAGINKRFADEEGDYYPYLWGAFYREDRTKQTDAQLFVNVHPDHVNVGLGVAGARGSVILKSFHKNLEAKPEVFLALLDTLPEGIEIVTAESHGMKEKERIDIRTAEDIHRIMDLGLVDIQRRFSEDEEILYTPIFADQVGDLFEALHPLFKFITTEDISALEALVIEEAEVPIDIEVLDRYTAEQFCAETYLDPAYLRQMENLLRDKKQLIFFGPPGTGKTWIAKKLARYWVDAGQEPGGEVRTIQFHPSYAYEEFMEGIRPESIETFDGRFEITYPIRPGFFREFCDAARKGLNKRYVLIVDEINRGELPRIFGELMFLLEYRTEVITLPYSKERFSIPQNVFMIGTMNTADRSIALVDHALRRRFHFEKLTPSPEVLRRYLEDTNQVEMLWVADLLAEVNRHLEMDGIEWHLHIGHSHFMRPNLDETQLRMTWRHSIMPTLEEYFYRQPDQLMTYGFDELLSTLGVG